MEIKWRGVEELILEQCKSRYYSQSGYEGILDMVQEKISLDIEHIENEMLSLFYDFLYKEPYHYWNKKIYQRKWKCTNNNL